MGWDRKLMTEFKKSKLLETPEKRNFLFNDPDTDAKKNCLNVIVKWRMWKTIYIFLSKKRMLRAFFLVEEKPPAIQIHHAVIYPQICHKVVQHQSKSLKNNVNVCDSPNIIDTNWKTKNKKQNEKNYTK